jgi:outer membrane protein assembly factor BamB
MYRDNVERSGASSESVLSAANAPYLDQKWTYDTGATVASSPAIVGNSVYVGSWNGFEYALNATTGSVLWKTFLGKDDDPACYPPDLGVTSSAAVSNGVVYVGGGDSYWYALSAATGAVLWDLFTGPSTENGGNYNWSSPLIYGNYAYIGVASNCSGPSVQGKLLKVSLTTHQVVATADMVPNGQVGGGIWSSPTLNPATDTIFVATGSLTLYSQTLAQAVVALNANTLTVQSYWQLPFEEVVFDSDFGTTPVLTVGSQGQQLVSAANKNGIVYTFLQNDLAAGPLWQHQIAIGGDCAYCGDGTVASGIFADGTLYWAGGNSVDSGGVGHQGSITAFNPATGAILWTHYTGGIIVGSPSYDNGVIYVPAGSTMVALNASNGQAIWTYDLGSITWAAPAIADGTLFQGTLDGLVHAFGLPASLPTPPPGDPNCPVGLTCQSVGHPDVAGSEVVSHPGYLTVTASGLGMRGSLDQMRMVTEPVVDNAQVSAEFLDLRGSAPARQAGIVMRSSNAPGAPAYEAVLEPAELSNGRPGVQLTVLSRDRWNSPPIELAGYNRQSLPVWIMVQRVDDTFQTLSSRDGKHWLLVPGSIHMSVLPSTVLAGVAVAAGSAQSTVSVAFSHLSAASPTQAYSLARSAHPCPPSWSCVDVGDYVRTGDQTETGMTWQIDGTGSGIGSTFDQFHFVYRDLTGDGTVRARLISFSRSSVHAQAAILMRANDSPGAPYYGVVVSANGTATVQWRIYDRIENRTVVSLPRADRSWLEIDRYTDTRHGPPTTYYSVLTSPNGVTWKQVVGSTVAVDLGATPLAGIGSSSDSTWTHFAIQHQDLPPPGVCPPGFSCQDVGFGYAAGGQNFTGPLGDPDSDIWTFYAGGEDISSTYDQFHFVYQPLTSDGTVSVEVLSVQPHPGYDDSWAKAGIMLRATTNTASAYYGIFHTPGHGIAVQWRTAQSAGTSQVLVAGPSPTVPVYLLIGRWTSPEGVTYYTAYTSTDNKHFAAVHGTTVAMDMPKTLLAGMAADAFTSDGHLNVTFTKFAILPGNELPPP